ICTPVRKCCGTVVFVPQKGLRGVQPPSKQALRIAAAGAVALVVFGACAVQASASCNPGRSSGVIGYWWDGWKRPASNIPNGNIGDTYSRILEASPYVESVSFDT